MGIMIPHLANRPLAATVVEELTPAPDPPGFELA